MPADIFASLQLPVQPQKISTNKSQAKASETESQSGRFASMMTDLTESESSATSQGQSVSVSEVETAEEAPSFTGKSFFAGTVLDVLADSQAQETEAETFDADPELLQAVIDDAVIWPEDVKESVNLLTDKVKNLVQENFADGEISDAEAEQTAEQLITEEGLAELSEEIKQEVIQAINDTVNVLKHEGKAESQPIVKILDSLVEHISSPKAEAKPTEDDEIDEPEDSADIPEAAAQTAGLAVVANTQPQAVQSDSEPQAKHDILDAPAKRQQPRQVRAYANNEQAPQESQEASEAPKDTQTFRETLEGRNTEQESSGQDQDQNPSQDSGQPGGGFTGGQNSSSRSRTDSRRVDSRNQLEHADSTTTHRTESRTDFQTYFEGVLTSRRTSASTSPLPLSLRTTANFTQSSALRDGIVNVVRFIRADGVQKANIVVDPPALGRISVELTSGTSGVEASIKVASEQIRQLVQDQLSQLRMNLSEQGVQVAEFTVDVQQDNSGQHNPQDQNQERGRLNFIGSVEEDEAEEFRVDLEEGLLWWVA